MTQFIAHADDCEMSILDASFKCTCGARPVAICIIPNCGRSAPAHEAFCSKHREKPALEQGGQS